MSRISPALVLVAATLCACGGGSPTPPPSNNSGGSGSGSGSGSVSYTAGVYPPSSSLAAKCAKPRTGNDPHNGNMPYPDVQGSTAAENNFLRSWTNELYLWFNEVQDYNPNSYTSTADFFDLLKTSAMTPSGAAKDKFHFTYDTATWEQLSQSGVQLGYGIIWSLDNGSATSPRSLMAAYVQSGTPGSNAQIVRGDQVLSIDGASITANDSASIATLDAGLDPTTAGSHTFVVKDPNGTQRTVSMTATTVTETTVPVVTTIAAGSGNVGYLLFNDHLATSESELIAAVNTLKSQSITDLVLDIRYNGGGYLDIASELAYMIAGTAQTSGRSFYLQSFNSKNPSTNPVSGQALTPVAFHSTTQGLSTTSGQALPALNLSRVFILTGPETCSASEAVMNGLMGVNVNVIQIGSTTCGKPYGFYPQDNCGTTYFSIEFKGENDKSFGDYPDGFTPSNATARTGVSVTGCSVADDFTHDLGNASESLLSSAISYSTASVCPLPPSGSSGRASIKRQTLPRAQTLRTKSPLRENMIFR
jgi:carboxyl-terminal processing protease